MARMAKEKVTIEDTVYYTPKFFAVHENVSERTARDFLKKYECKEGSKSPRIYEKEIMTLAQLDYNRRKGRTHTKEQKEILKEKIRLGIEEDDYYNEWNLAHSIQETDERDPYDFDEIIDRLAKQNMIEAMLRHLFALHDYQFDEKKYLDDFKYEYLAEKFREAGQARTKKHRNVIKRLSSDSAYLIKK